MTATGTATTPSIPKTKVPMPAPGDTTPDVPSPAPGDKTPRTPVEDASSKNQGFLAETWRGFVHAGMVAKDEANLVGVNTDDGLSLSPASLATVAGLDLGVSGIVAAMHGRERGLSFSDTVWEGVSQAGTNALRVTPTLISAIAGPAVADGLSYIAPTILPKYKKEMKPAEKSRVQIERAIIGGAAVGILAGLAFLIKPTLFKKTGLFNEAAISSLGAGLNAEGRMAKSAVDAVFSNRVILGAAGALGTLYLTGKAVDSNDPNHGKYAIAAGVAGAVTLAAIGIAPKITRGAEGASKLAFMPGEQHALFFKPTLKWLGEYGKKVAPLTMIPAGMSASQYYDIVSDFDTITSAKSPFNK